MMRALTCHAGDPGSIPGVCLHFILFLSHLEFKIASFGEPYYFGQTSYGIPPLELTLFRKLIAEMIHQYKSCLGITLKFGEGQGTFY